VRVVLDVTPLFRPRTGIGNYLHGLLRGLVEVRRDGDEVVAFAIMGPRRKPIVERALEGLELERRLITVPPSAHTWRTLWSKLGRFPLERLVGRFDAFHFSDWMFPPQRGGVRATTVYDVIPIHFPKWVPPRTRMMHRRKYANAARTCDVIFAISEFSADDVSATLSFPRERVRVAYPGVDAHYTPDGERADFGAPYLLTVATLEPRKNLPTLLDAFKLLRREQPDLTLAVVGAEGWGERPDLAVEGVHLLGYVREEELPALYRGAGVSVYPSLYEGFGMPIVESMACGTPVVSSAHPSLDEASAGIALRADPKSAESFAEQIERALARREELRAQGLEHAKRFSWRACAEAVRRGYELAA
jgi:glycosyltransferase involved in cell wall biosynthesis